ncbi:MAG: transcription-repair coupling factor, partial [Bacteroidota bacterium]
MDNLGLLLSRFDTHPVVHAVINRLNQDEPPVRMQVTGLTGALESFVMAAVARNYRPGQGNIHLIIANDKEEAAFRLNDLEGMLGKTNVFFFPDSFKKPRAFDVLNQTQILQRSETISKITMQSGVSVVVTYPEALFEKVVKPEVVQQNLIQVRKGEKRDVDYMI